LPPSAKSRKRAAVADYRKDGARLSSGGKAAKKRAGLILRGVVLIKKESAQSSRTGESDGIFSLPL
jgi:hypothetical protein